MSEWPKNNPEQPGPEKIPTREEVVRRLREKPEDRSPIDTYLARRQADLETRLRHTGKPSDKELLELDREIGKMYEEAGHLEGARDFYAGGAIQAHLNNRMEAYEEFYAAYKRVGGAWEEFQRLWKEIGYDMDSES